MATEPLEQIKDGYVVTSDRGRLPIEAALALLRTTDWAREMSRETLARAMDHSICFGVLRGAALVGFARVVTDRATFAYLTDVVIAPEERGRGLGRWMTECILSHPDAQGLRRFSLLTRDSQEFYAALGFVVGTGELTYMERRQA
jgi:N-acetylglutamate synthase-like GNAT family acetyltransferase